MNGVSLFNSAKLSKYLSEKASSLTRFSFLEQYQIDLAAWLELNSLG
jgi:hypothetical protein